MLPKNEIDQAIIAVAETKSPQSKIIRRHAAAINDSIAAGAPMKEILLVLFKLTGVKIDQRWAYRILSNERKRKGINVQQSSRSVKSATPKAVGARGDKNMDMAQSLVAASTVTAPACNENAGLPIDMAIDELKKMLPPKPLDGAAEVDHPLPANLPSGINMELLKRVTKMDGFNASWHTEPNEYNLLSSLPEFLPTHIQPIIAIGDVTCDLRRGVPAEFGTAVNDSTAQRGTDQWEQADKNKKLRAEWRSHYRDALAQYNQWLKNKIGLLSP